MGEPGVHIQEQRVPRLMCETHIQMPHIQIHIQIHIQALCSSLAVGAWFWAKVLGVSARIGARVNNLKPDNSVLHACCNACYSSLLGGPCLELEASSLIRGL